MKIAVDFDGTCVDHRYPQIGPDVPNCVSVLKKLVESNHQIILYTMRSGEALEDAVQWFVNREIPLSGINCDPAQSEWTQSPKCFANHYIDDAAIGCPKREYENFKGEAVDWEAVESLLIDECVFITS